MSPVRQVLRRRRITSDTTDAPLRSTTPGVPLRRFWWWFDTRWGLVLMFAVALGLRLVVAPHFGFKGDLQYFQRWSQGLHAVGIGNFYDSVGDTTYVYPPGYLYVLDLLGRLSDSPSYLLVKLPAILADLALAWVAGVFAVRLAPAELRRRIPVRALVVAAVLFNPAVFALSTVWGQVDAVPAVFVVASLLLLLTGRQRLRREIVAIVLFAVAFSMKPQSSFIFPVIGYLLFRRYLYRQRFKDLWRGLLRIVAVGAPGLALWALSGIPFGLSPSGLLDFYSKASNGYKTTTVWAFNVWGLSGFQKGDVRTPFYGTLLVGGIPAFYVGMLAYLAGTAYVLWRVHRSINRGHNEARLLLVSSVMVSLIAYMFLTRMHERYMFPVLACLAPLVIWRGFRWIYAALSLLFVVNLWYPFALFNRGWFVSTFEFQSGFNWIFGNIDATDTWQKQAWSLFGVVTCVVLVLRGFRWIERVDDAPPPLSPPVVAPLDDEILTNGVVAANGAATAVVTASAVEPEATEPVPVPETEPEPTARWLRILPLSLVLVACVFNLVVLRSEVTPTNNLNDSAFHMEMVRWADHQIGEGRVPLDGWFANLGLGSSFFHHYQSLPYTVTAYAARVTGLSVQTTYLWFQYLMLALWPIAVYLGARLLSLERWQAAAAALLSPLIVSVTGYGYEHGSYTFQGLGVYTQLFGMWLLPIAWGLTWRAVSRGEKWYAPAALALALTMATHLMTGYLAVLTVGVWVLIARRGFVRRVGRAAIVSIGALGIAAWVLVPLLADRHYSAQTEIYKGTIFNDSYGASRITEWLRTGELFDHGRFPIFTLLLAVGFVMCVIRCRRSEAARAVLGAWTLSMLLFFGRATFGSLVKILPGNGDLQMHRFMAGVDLAAILMAGIGLVAVATWVALGLTRLIERVHRGWAKPALVWSVIGVASVLMLAPAWSERAHYDLNDGSLISYQRAYERLDGADFKALVEIAKQRGDGRVYAGMRANWGDKYRIGSVPGYAELENYDADAIGYPFRTVQALSTDVDASFDENIPAQYEILNIKYLIIPTYGQPVVPATKIETRGRHTLYEVDTSGYFQVVDVQGVVTADRTNIGSASRQFLYSDRATHDVYPSVAFDGAAPLADTISGLPPIEPPGAVIKANNAPLDGTYTANVELERPAVVLLKESFDPRWTVTVDGESAQPVMMAPSFVGVQVDSGSHVVAFHYKSYPHYPLLAAFGIATLLALALWPYRGRIRGAFGRKPASAAVAAGPAVTTSSESD